MRLVRFMKCVARAVVKEGIHKLAKLAEEFVPFGRDAIEFAGNVAKRTVDEVAAEGMRKELPAAIQEQASASDADCRKAAETVVLEVAPHLPEADRRNLTEYLSQLSLSFRTSLKRPDDPEGKTVPFGWNAEDPLNLAQGMPTGLPRFHAGDPAPEPKWKLVRLLGRGGMGEVWLGQHTTYAGLQAAYKFCLDPQGQKALLGHDGEVVARLTHMNIGGVVKMQGADTDPEPGRIPWLKYEYVPDGDLTVLLYRWKDEPPATRTPQILRAWLRLAEIVGKLHELDDPIIHRDLKPANVLMRWNAKSNDYELYVADFGISAITARRNLQELTKHPTVTATLGLLRGACTPIYASPQQKAGGDPDPRDDVFSLGVIGYQLLLGRFDRERPAGRAWKVALRALLVPEAVIELIEASCDDEPGERPANAKALAEHLNGALQTAPPVPATPTSETISAKPKEPPAPISVPFSEAPAQRVRRLKEEAARMHEDARAFVELHDYEEAVKLLDGFRPELIPQRDQTLLTDVTAKRDQLRHLHTQIHSLLDAGNLKDLRLPIWLGSYLAIKPNDAEKIELAKEFPPPKAGSRFTNELGMEFAFIPPGSFMMGSPNGVGQDIERPQRQVTIASGFFMGVVPVTQEQWQRVMGNNPSNFKNPKHPVEQVSWLECQEFVAKLREKDGWSYRLPSEAEWEYASRAGTTSAYFFGDGEGRLNEFAWFDGNSGKTTHPVGQKKPNPWGLFDISGNVWEWCEDLYGPYDKAPTDGKPQTVKHSDNRVLRGGSWISTSECSRCAYRYFFAPAIRNLSNGLRVVFALL